jgi:alpha-D-ribose 1-methylphosphonate 5-triphosphate diphosphatase PhnM
MARKEGKPFQVAKPRTPKGEARKREQELMEKLAKLMEIDDEQTFEEGLQADFGIRRDDPRFEQIKRVWRGGQ